MTTGQILLAILTGLIVNECCDMSPWLARKLVRWSAHRRYTPAARAELRAEELAAYIDDRPGRLFKLITALGFAIAAVVTRKVAHGVASSTPRWRPTMLIFPIRYEKRDHDDRLAHHTKTAVHQAWCRLADEVRDGASKVGISSRSWRRCIRKLGKVTNDRRWASIESNLFFLETISRSSVQTNIITVYSGTLTPVGQYAKPMSILTDSSVTHYLAAVETTRSDIRHLISDFLLSSAPR